MILYGAVKPHIKTPFQHASENLKNKGNIALFTDHNEYQIQVH